MMSLFKPRPAESLIVAWQYDALPQPGESTADRLLRLQSRLSLETMVKLAFRAGGVRLDIGPEKSDAEMFVTPPDEDRHVWRSFAAARGHDPQAARRVQDALVLDYGIYQEKLAKLLTESGVILSSEQPSSAGLSQLCVSFTLEGGSYSPPDIREQRFLS